MTRKKWEIRCFGSGMVFIEGCNINLWYTDDEIERFLSFLLPKKVIYISSLQVSRSNYSRNRDIQPRFI